MNTRLIIFVALFHLLCTATVAQEFNCKVTINSDKIEGTNKQVFVSMQDKLTEFVNNRKWTDAQFNTVEKLNTNIMIILNSVESDERFSGEIQIQSNRPVFNSTYMSPVFNFRDKEFSFGFSEFQQLDYNQNSISDNLTAVIVFYIYLLVGLDFDSFSPHGGLAYYQQAMNIANMAQSLNEPGWKPFDTKVNRHSIVSDLVEEGGKSYREFLYIYHRKGLDEMALNVDKGRKAIYDALPTLKTLYTNRPSSALISLFGDTKLDEVVNIFSKAPQEEREEVFKQLNSIYPTYSSRLEPLRQRQ